MSTKLLTICIPSRNRPDQLEKLVQNLCACKFTDEVDIVVFESVTISRIRSANEIEYFNTSVDITFGEKLSFFFRKLKGKYVFILSDDDTYDFSNLLELIRNVKIKLLGNDELYLFKIGEHSSHNLSDYIKNGKLPFYLISSYIFKMNCHDQVCDNNSTWFQNYLLHNYFIGDYKLICVKNNAITYMPGNGFDSANGIDDFYTCLTNLGKLYSIKISEDNYWSEYKYTQRRIAKSIIENSMLESDSNLKYFLKYRKPFEFNTFVAFVVLNIYYMFAKHFKTREGLHKQAN